MLVVLGPGVTSKPDLVASLLTFRVIYYLIPFLIGGTTFLGVVARQGARRNAPTDGAGTSI